MTTTKATTKRMAFSVQPDGPIARLESIVGEQNLPDTITNMLNRYFALLHRTSPKFTDRELCAMFDALGEHYKADPHQVQQLPREISSAITTDRLDAKWSVDAESIRNRLDRSTFTDRLNIAEMSAAYWLLSSEDEFPQVTIQRIKNLIQPAPPASDATRPRRISPDLFDAGTPDAVHQNRAANNDNPDNSDLTPAEEESDSIPNTATSPELPLDDHPAQHPSPAST